MKEITLADLSWRCAGDFLPKEKEQKKNPGKIDWDRARQIALCLPERERCLFRGCLREGTAVRSTRDEGLPPPQPGWCISFLGGLLWDGGVPLALGSREAELSFIHRADKQLHFVARVTRVLETAVVIAGLRTYKIGKTYLCFYSKWPCP